MSVFETESDILKDGKLIGEYLRQTQYYTNIYGKNTILIMLVGSFYEIYALKSNENQEYYEGSAIEEVSHICDLVVKQKAHKYKNKFLYQSGFRDLYWDKYVERLTQNNFCVVKFDQDEKDKTVRKLSQIFSPGTFFQNTTFKLSNNTTCIWVERFTSTINPCYIFGFATIDIYSGKTNIFELRETPIQNKILGDELERYLTIYNPSEVICIFRNLSENDIVGSMLEKMLNHHCTMVTYITSNSAPELWKQILNCSKDTYIETSVNQFYDNEYVDIILNFMRDTSVALQSLIYLLHWIVSHNPYLIENLKVPLLETHSKHVYLANNSLKQLNYNDNNTTRYIRDNVDGHQKYGSVVELLNQCNTPMGKREFQIELCHPIFDVQLLQEKYDIIEEVLNSHNMIEECRKILRSSFDVDKLKRSLIMNKVTPNMLHNLYVSLQTVIPIYDIIKSSKRELLIKTFINFRDETRNQTLEEYDVKTLCNDFTKIFCEMFDINQLTNNHSVPLDKNIFQKGYDNELDSIELRINDNELQIQHIIDSLQRLLIQGGYEKKNKSELVKINFTEKSPPTLLCTKKRGENIVKAIQSISKTKNDPNANNLSLFTTKGDLLNITISKYTASNVSLNCDYIHKLMKEQFTLQIKYKTLLNETFNRAKLELKTYYSSIDVMCSFLSLIDINITKGFVIQKYNYIKPKIEKYENTFENKNKREKTEEREKLEVDEEDKENTLDITSYFTAKDLRHCLIEQFQNDDTYVANDICFDSRQQGVLLFGTNAVGKTCFMKAIGIAIIMAQCGMYVPCSEFTYYPYKKLFTRILNQDNIFKGLSTFANEMTELRNILHNANNDSLVLGDELCSGTEHESALSIFVSGLSYLYSKNVQFLFATHLHEIVDYQEINEMERIKKYHLTVHYNREKDVLVYDRKLKPGSGIPIYGLEVCQSLHLPSDFINYAYNIRNKYHPSQVSVLNSNTSHFNSKKVVANCELCKNEKANEVHHLMYQKNANSNGLMNDMRNKNHKSNLLSLCIECHNKIHKENIELKRKKTTNGYILECIEPENVISLS